MPVVLQKLLESRKAIITCLALIIVGVLAATGKVSAADFLSTLKWLVVTFVGGLALEGASEKFFLPPSSSAAPLPLPLMPPPAKIEEESTTTDLDARQKMTTLRE